MTTTAEKIKAMQAYADGQPIEFRSEGGDMWSHAAFPAWNWNSFEYRIAPTPPPEPDVVPWYIIQSNWTWCARDENGETWFYEDEPDELTNGWSLSFGKSVNADDVIKIQNNGMPWRESKQKRPEVQERPA